MDLIDPMLPLDVTDRAVRLRDELANQIDGITLGMILDALGVAGLYLVDSTQEQSLAVTAAYLAVPESDA